ncbi:MAG: TIGR00341 family protein [Sphingomonas sp. 28-66-16]|nr:MAG: TIGR00341 family protein [Sphingomonas sp. 28-66-16]
MLTDLAGNPVDHRWQHSPVYRWWRHAVVDTVDQRKVMERIAEDSGWSGRYAFMTTMSAGIAVLGLLLSSPAVVIGAMLISPLMGPILGLGFGLALFDYTAARRSLVAVLIGSFAAIVFSALIVLASPLKAPTAEILARTQPNLFDLLVALFAALAGTFAIIRGRGDTIVGVAIATALMPPLAVVGYGLATWNMPVLGGSFALFITNLMTIALAATVMARFYGFGHYLSGQQGWTQTIVLTLVFVSMSVPLGFSLNRIARETVTASQVRTFLGKRYGANARITQLDIAFDRKPIAIQTVVIAPRGAPSDTAKVQADLSKRLGQPVKLQVDLVLLDPRAGAIDAQRAELQQASAATAAENAAADRVADLVALGAGIARDDVTIDRDHHRATATAARLPGATGATYRALEQRIDAAADDWSITLIPPSGGFPTIRFADNSDTLDATAQQAVALSIWQAKRWNVGALAVPGLVDGAPPEKPTLNQRRALAIAALLRAQSVQPVAAPAAGQAFALAVVAPPTPSEDAP